MPLQRAIPRPTQAQQRRQDDIREIGRLISVPDLPYTYVDRLGNVYSEHPKSRWRGRLHRLTPADNGRGYLRVRCHGKSRCVHSVVAVAVLGPRPEGREINHIDGDKKNNRPENLEYVTRSQNMKHCHRMGLARNPEGERHHNAKMTIAKVRELRSEYRALCVNDRLRDGEMRRLTDKYGITQPSVTAIARGQRWKCVT